MKYNPVFKAYLVLSLDNSVLFVDDEKVGYVIAGYINGLGVTIKAYDDIIDYVKNVNEKLVSSGKVLIVCKYMD